MSKYLLPIILDQSFYRSQLKLASLLEDSVEYLAKRSRDFSNGSHD